MHHRPYVGSIRVTSLCRTFHGSKRGSPERTMARAELTRLVGKHAVKDLLKSQNAPGQRTIPITSQAQEPPCTGQ